MTYVAVVNSVKSLPVDAQIFFGRKEDIKAKALDYLADAYVSMFPGAENLEEVLYRGYFYYAENSAVAIVWPVY